MILIQDGYMIDPKSGKEGNFDILIDGDKIVKIAEKIEPKGKVTRINAEGLIVAPGLVDEQVHFRDPGFPAMDHHRSCGSGEGWCDHRSADGEHEAHCGQ